MFRAVFAFSPSKTAGSFARRGIQYSSIILRAEGGRQSNAVSDKNLLDKTSDTATKQKKEKLDTNPPKGTRDFYPEDMRQRTWLFQQWRDVAKAYGFS